MFDKKGIYGSVPFSCKPTTTFRMMYAGVVTVKSGLEQALEAAIEAGGEDVREGDDESLAKVVCDFTAVMAVKEKLAAAGLAVHDFGHEYIPNTTTALAVCVMHSSIMLATRLCTALKDEVRESEGKDNGIERVRMRGIALDGAGCGGV